MEAPQGQQAGAEEAIPMLVPGASRAATGVEPARGWHVERVTDWPAFLALEPVWKTLARAANLDHPFGTFEWMRSWWTAFGRRHKLSIMVVKSGRDVAAIAPLMLTRGRLCGLPVLKLESIGNDHTPRFEFIVPPGAEHAYDVLWRGLARDALAWDVLQISQVPTACATLDIVHRLAAQSQWPVGQWIGDDSPYVEIRDIEDGFPIAAHKKHRSNVRRQLNRLEELGTVDLEIVDSEARLAAALADGFRLEAGEWKIAAGTAIVSSREVEAFYRTLAAEYAEAGTLRLLFLRSNGRRVGFAFGVRHRDTFHILKCGYAIDYARFAPVHLLCHLFFRQAADVGLTTFEFLGASEEWKLKWTNEAKGHRWLYVFRDVWWGRLLHRTKFGLVPQLRTRHGYQSVRDVVMRRFARRSWS